MQRVDVLILARQVHCPDSHLMHVRVLKHFLPLHAAKVVVKDCNCEEVGPRRALERRRHFDHPINHLGAVLFANIVRVKRRFSSYRVACYKVFVNFNEQSQLVVLFLLRCRLLRAHKTLVPLFSRSYRPSIAASCDIFDSDDVLFHCICIA